MSEKRGAMAEAFEAQAGVASPSLERWAELMRRIASVEAELGPLRRERDDLDKLFMQHKWFYYGWQACERHKREGE